MYFVFAWYFFFTLFVHQFGDYPDDVGQSHEEPLPAWTIVVPLLRKARMQGPFEVATVPEAGMLGHVKRHALAKGLRSGIDVNRAADFVAVEESVRVGARREDV